jgi:exodeoxyribonuclease VII small subunit
MTDTTGSEESFEEMLQRVEEILYRMEGAEVTLDESLALFEEGVGLLRRLEERMGDAEGRVRELLEDGGLRDLADPEGPET